MTLKKTLLISAAVAALGAGAAQAGHLSYYKATFENLNNMDVSGFADFVYNETDQTLFARIFAQGLKPGERHAQHIHGIEGGDSKVPTLETDDDGDGFIELAEALPDYGPVILPLVDPETGEFPLAEGDTLDVSFTYDLTDGDIYNDGFGIDDLMPGSLENREVVLHGAMLFEGDGANGGEADGTAGYKGRLPVLAGEIETAEAPSPVPLPASLPLFAAGFGLLGVGAARKRKKAGA